MFLDSPIYFEKDQSVQVSGGGYACCAMADPGHR